ncbi:MAG: type I methionyl aminopeptidase [Firmicutes bacterium]|nr:type I methionyl aminopeptidase [Bacillota bacterium]
MITLKSDMELGHMRKAGHLVALALEKVAEEIKPGVATGDLDRMLEGFFLSQGAIPAFKGYNGFPASICASVDDEVVHGIPGRRVLEEGQIISIDVGAIVEGFYGDAAMTLPVGKISPAAQRLIDATRQSLERGITFAVEGNRLSDISHAIQTYVESVGFSVVRDFVGHGIGREMHEFPQIPNFGRPGHGPRLKPGMTLAVEPMVNAGGFEVVTDPDNWTVRTRDGSLSAHFEHTIAVTENGPEILTR